MTAYETFKAFHKDNYYNWEDFSGDLGNWVLEDKYLKALVNRYQFLADKFEDIEINFVETLVSELSSFAWFESEEKISINEVYGEVINISSDTFKTIIAEFIPSTNKNDFPLSIQDDKKFEVNELLYEQFADELKLEEKNIKEAESYFTVLELDRGVILSKIRQWNAKYTVNRIRPRLKKVQLIQNPNYFDPSIYQIIQKNPELLKTLDWRIFEEMLADILRSLKYNVELTKMTRDGGIDIIAIKKDKNFGDHKYILQAKRYTDAVQVQPVRELLFLHNEHRASKCCLATTSRFTSGALEYAEKYKWMLELKDQTGILDWINQVTKLKRYS